MSTARKAVDSTLRRILIYTAEIIMSIILLVVICIPLAFGIPIWFQTVVFGAARSELVINPVAWFGAGGAFWVTLLLSLVSIFIGYVYVYRLVPSADSGEEEEEEEEEAELTETQDEEEVDEEEEEEEIDEPEDEIAADSQEEESD
ncbi:MAG: hypothetical protein ACXABV_04090 [Candidatus Thorarchaeota archaeon]|jgi:hypothetical protein